MDVTNTEGIEPVIFERPRGGWLALTRAELPLRMGVIGRSEEEARRLFEAAIARWARARDAERLKLEHAGEKKTHEEENVRAANDAKI